MTNFQDDCQRILHCSAHSPLPCTHTPLKIPCESSYPLVVSGGNLLLSVSVLFPLAASLWNKANFPFHQLGSLLTFKQWTPRPYFFLNFNFNWRHITLQYCGGFCHTVTWISHVYTYVSHPEPPSHLPSLPIPQGHPSAPALSTLSHASNLDWQLILNRIIYMFRFSQIIPPLPSPTESKSLFFTSVSLSLSRI